MGAAELIPSPRSPLHVCLVTGEYPPAIGGIADYTALLARHLRDAGMRVSIATTLREGGAGEDAIAVPGWGFRSLAALSRRIAAAQPDIVHLQYQTAAFGMNPAISFLPLALKAAGSRSRFITTFHDLRVPYLFPGAGRLRAAPARALLGACDGCIFTSQVDLRAARPRRAGVWIPIGPGVVPRGRPNRRTARERLHIDADTFTIAYFGFMNSTKGIETLLGAADELVRSELDFRLLFVGEDRGESDPTNADISAGARRLSSQSGLEQRVIRTGWLPPAEISRALWAADVAALPYTDGASLRRSTLITCFAHGVPVVTTSPIAQPAVPEQCLVEPFDEPEQYVIDDTVAALIPAGDHMALAGQLRRLAADAARRKALGRAGRKLAQGLSWPTIAAATARFYDRVVGNAA